MGRGGGFAAPQSRNFGEIECVLCDFATSGMRLRPQNTQKNLQKWVRFLAIYVRNMLTDVPKSPTTHSLPTPHHLTMVKARGGGGEGVTHQKVASFPTFCRKSYPMALSNGEAVARDKAELWRAFLPTPLRSRWSYTACCTNGLGRCIVLLEPGKPRTIPSNSCFWASLGIQY